MANIQVTTNQNVIEVTETGGVNVTTTTDEITVLTSGTLIVEAPTSTTDRLINGSNQVILNSNSTMTFPNNVIDFGSQSADLKSSSYSELWYHTANPTPTAGQGIQTYIWGWENQAGIAVESLDENGDNRYKEWYFNANGTTTFPTLTVPVNDVGYTDVTGQVLKFSDPSKQAIIYGPAATTGSAQRMLLQGAPGADGSTGEGGDVYIWAGRGGSVVDEVGGGDGGDVKVRAGQGRGGASGGYVRIQGGDSDTGVGGFVDIQGGDGTGNGGYTRILSDNNIERIKVDRVGVQFNQSYTFPTYDGDANQVLKTDGDGNLSWSNAINPFNQDLNTTDSVTFNDVAVDGDLRLNGDKIFNSTNDEYIRLVKDINNTKFIEFGAPGDYDIKLYTEGVVFNGDISQTSSTSTLVTTAANQVIDQYDKNGQRASNYVVQIKCGSDYEIWEGMLLHDDTNVFTNAYGELRTAGQLATITADISGDFVRLLATPTGANTTFRLFKTIFQE